MSPAVEASRTPSPKLSKTLPNESVCFAISLILTREILQTTNDETKENKITVTLTIREELEETLKYLCIKKNDKNEIKKTEKILKKENIIFLIG